ncbi:hypothetical protein EYC80_001982 [Monilinia laxa]|uniref:Uncharacterized protein n=1 Tax=Monilinia laxa TaxID=61186 RepID=A0A5N6K6U8_MONLA|nr:hypothetical protein EYC80_001982 [Monilinia laxa]
MKEEDENERTIRHNTWYSSILFYSIYLLVTQLLDYSATELLNYSTIQLLPFNYSTTHYSLLNSAYYSSNQLHYYSTVLFNYSSILFGLRDTHTHTYTHSYILIFKSNQLPSFLLLDRQLIKSIFTFITDRTDFRALGRFNSIPTSHFSLLTSHFHISL